MKDLKKASPSQINHIAFIMDGNGRWAKQRLMPRLMGHKKGVETLKKVTEAVFERGIRHVSVYAFSSENKERPVEEVKNLVSLVKEYLKRELKNFVKNEIRLEFMGAIDYFPKDAQEIINDSIEKTAHFSEKVLNIALNYGAQDEIVRAVNLAKSTTHDITKEEFASFLYTKNLPPPDLIVRTGGDKRLSNFMLFQAAYAELFFLNTLWPDFNENELDDILSEFGNRQRRFGKV
ncbi:MAG: polyprenyl diphosphate synthase [Firmicutes bacterium]|nr:polyprenyl diphosphate synthase [Bacillota bacterium]